MTSGSNIDEYAMQVALQVCSSTLSSIASLSIIVMILISPKKLTSSYGRIIFGMSFGDVMQSLAMLTGPFSVFSVNACDWNGFAFVCGSIMVPLYTFALSTRYFCRLNLKMSDERFGRKIERWIQVVIIMFVLGISITGFVMKLYNPMGSEAVCYFIEYPIGCLTDPEIYGECERGMQSHKFIAIVALVFTCSLLGVFINMTMLCFNSCWIERVFSNRTHVTTRVSTTASSGHGCFRDYLCCVFCWNYDQLRQESDSDYVLRLNRMETIIQSCLYVGAFYICYLPPVVQSILIIAAGVRLPRIILGTISFLYPLGGFFNVMIYTRPKVVRLRHAFPGCSRLKAFLLVLKNGGEMPDLDNDPNAMNLCPSRRNTSPEDGSETSQISVSERTRTRNHVSMLVSSFE